MRHTRNGSYGMGDIALPNLDQLLAAAQGAITGQIASSVINDPSVKAAAAQGAATSFGTKFYTYLQAHKKELIYGGAAVGALVVGLVVYNMVKK